MAGAQEERRVVEVLSALLRTYGTAAPEGGHAAGSSPARRASCELPPRSQQVRCSAGRRAAG